LAIKWLSQWLSSWGDHVTKAKRQGYREGSVYQRASDGRWVATIEAGWTQSNKRRRITLTGKSETEVKRKLRDKKQEIVKAEAAPAGGRRMTVKAWADEWLPLTERVVRPSTFTTHRGAVRKWIVPTIGARRLADLGPRELRAVADAQRRDGMASSSILRTQRVLVKMLRDAVEEGHTVPSSVFTIKAPGKGVSDRDAFSLEEALAVLTTAAERPDKSRWAAAFLQGIRQGERNGLTWDAVDFDRHLLAVEWQLQSLPYIDRKDKALGFRVPDDYEARQLEAALHLVRPKSQRGLRLIPMVPWFENALRDWRDACPYPNPHGLVWRRPDGRPIPKSLDSAEWKQLQDDAKVQHPSGRPYTGHETRHTTATLLMEAGVDPVVITAILGHSSIVVSRGYMHANQQHALEAMEKVAARLRLELPPG